MGNCTPEQWGITSRKVDFYDLKADVEALLPPEIAFEFTRSDHPALHPGQAAALLRGGEVVGHLGAIHPQVAKNFDLDGTIFLFEIDLAALTLGQLPCYKPVSKFPMSRRDIALVVQDNTDAATILRLIRQHGGSLLRDAFLFDVYRGKGLAENEKSLAFGLILQDFSSNLTDAAVDNTVSQIVTELKNTLDCRLR